MLVKYEIMDTTYRIILTEAAESKAKRGRWDVNE